MTIVASRILKIATVLTRPWHFQRSSEDIKSHAATLKEVNKLATVEQLRHIRACSFNNIILSFSSSPSLIIFSYTILALSAKVSLFQRSLTISCTCVQPDSERRYIILVAENVDLCVCNKRSTYDIERKGSSDRSVA